MVDTRWAQQQHASTVPARLTTALCAPHQQQQWQQRDLSNKLSYTSASNASHKQHITGMLLLALFRAGWYLRFWKPRSEGPLRSLSEARL
jgi:hypothetical protein